MSIYQHPVLQSAKTVTCISQTRQPVSSILHRQQQQQRDQITPSMSASITNPRHNTSHNTSNNHHLPSTSSPSSAKILHQSTHAPLSAPKRNSASIAKETSIPRPRNCWIIYCSQNRLDLPQNISTTQKTKILAEKWQNEPEHVKQHYAKLAEEEERLHREKYPDYRYRPVRRKGKKQDAFIDASSTASKDVDQRNDKSNFRTMTGARNAARRNMDTRQSNQMPVDSHTSSFSLLFDHEELNAGGHMSPSAGNEEYDTQYPDTTTTGGGIDHEDEEQLLFYDGIDKSSFKRLRLATAPSSCNGMGFSEFEQSAAGQTLLLSPTEFNRISASLCCTSGIDSVTANAAASTVHSATNGNTATTPLVMDTQFDFGLPSPNDMIGSHIAAQMNTASCNHAAALSLFDTTTASGHAISATPTTTPAATFASYFGIVPDVLPGDHHGDGGAIKSHPGFFMGSSGMAASMFPISPAEDIFHTFLDQQQRQQQQAWMLSAQLLNEGGCRAYDEASPNLSMLNNLQGQDRLNLINAMAAARLQGKRARSGSIVAMNAAGTVSDSLAKELGTENGAVLEQTSAAEFMNPFFLPLMSDPLLYPDASATNNGGLALGTGGSRSSGGHSPDGSVSDAAAMPSMTLESAAVTPANVDLSSIGISFGAELQDDLFPLLSDTYQWMSPAGDLSLLNSFASQESEQSASSNGASVSTQGMLDATGKGCKDMTVMQKQVTMTTDVGSGSLEDWCLSFN